MKPYGALIPPYFNHQPAVVVGNRNYLLALKEAIEEALEEGIGVADVFMSDGEGHYLFVKLEEEVEEIPTCYAHFELTKEKNLGKRAVDDYCFFPDEWVKAVNLACELEDFCKVWERMHTNLYAFLHYLFFEKCYKERMEKGKNPLTCVRLHNRFSKLAGKLFYDEKGYKKLPSIEEWNRLFNKLKRLNIPRYCMRTIFYGVPEEVKTCLDLSLELIKAGTPDRAFEGIGIVSRKEFSFLPEGWYFLFKEKSCSEVKGLKLKEGWIYREGRLFIPIENSLGGAKCP